MKLSKLKTLIKECILEIKDSQSNVELFKKKYNISDNDEIYDLFKRFNKNLPRLTNKDIFKYSSLNDLTSALNNTESTISKTQSKINISKNEVEKIFDNEECLVIKPLTHNAIMKYGSGTKWCITSEDGEHYKQYLDLGITFYFILCKKLLTTDHLYKICVIVYPNDMRKYRNSLDQIIDFNKISFLNLSESIFKSTPHKLQ